jgi:arylsulfatase
VVDIAPTLYEILGIQPPRVVHGHKQMKMDGISLAYTFDSDNVGGRKKIQFFDNNGSRGVYYNGWFASAFGPFIPWSAAQGGFDSQWDSETDEWQLYDLGNDFSQADDLSERYPERLNEMKKLFLRVAEDNKDFPIGAGNWLRLHPEDISSSPYDHWTFSGDTRRMPEFTAPGLGKKSNTVSIELEVGPRANGVLYALGGASGGLTCYLDDGFLVYEYNLMIIERYTARSKARVDAGRHTIVVDTSLARPAAPADIVLSLDGKEVARVRTQRTVPLAFTASETFDVGIDLGSPVSRDYAERRPFELDGKIDKLTVQLK